MAIKKFYRGSSTFFCNVCGRRTRDTGAQSAGNKICPQCFELAGLENEISDGHSTLEENIEQIVSLVKEVKEKGGNVDDWTETFAINL